jgi:uncharacterized DUF497 family protein
MAQFSRFDWDAGNLAKCQKHGVSIVEIEELFRSDPSVGRDERHSEVEDRYVAIGRNRVGRPIFVIFTFRVTNGNRLVRPVSARYMHRKEIDRYEQKAAKNSDR